MYLTPLAGSANPPACWGDDCMYELISKQIGADYFQQRFPNDGQRFVAWYLRNILFRDMNETRDDITDGADDKQMTPSLSTMTSHSCISCKANSSKAASWTQSRCGRFSPPGFRSKIWRACKMLRMSNCSADCRSCRPHADTFG
jgi:hypothetical protein